MLEDELNTLRDQCVGVIIVGDFNVHHLSWLRHSHSTTPEGVRLKSLVHDLGLSQRVRTPTRGQCLLDLVITDLPNLLTIEVVSKIADHRGFSIRFLSFQYYLSVSRVLCGILTVQTGLICGDG